MSPAPTSVSMAACAGRAAYKPKTTMVAKKAAVVTMTARLGPRQVRQRIIFPLLCAVRKLTRLLVAHGFAYPSHGGTALLWLGPPMFSIAAWVGWGQTSPGKLCEAWLYEPGGTSSQ